MFVSAARWYGKRVMGLLLSGGGSDGVVGLIGIKAAGGISLVQRPDEADHPWMPMTALRQDHVDAALSIADLVRVIPRLALGKEVRVARPQKGWDAWAGRPR